MSALTLLVLAKEPRPGRVKTRLTPPLSPQQAAAVAEAALRDTLRVVAAAPARRRVLVLDGEPGPWLPAGFDVVPQVAGGLDRRLAGAFAAVDGPALLVGMDTPQLTLDHLAVGLDPDDPADCVLGASADGGFWAVGMSAPVPEVFVGVPMSTDRTGEEQRTRLRAAGLRVRELARLRDVDTVADARAVAALAPATAFAAALRAVDPAQAAAGRSGAQARCSARPAGAAAATDPTELYDAAVRGERRLRLVARDGQVLPFDLERWTRPADLVDGELVARCEGVTLDVGCGPGRMAAAIARSGRPVLGVDVAAASVARTASSGALALRRSVFEPLPGEGRWGTVLLADGNLGIGADPDGLLRRVGELLRPGGLLLVEPEPEDRDERVHLRLVDDEGVSSAEFAWARVGVRAALSRAERAGLRLVERWTRDGRTFLALRRP